MRSPAFVLIVGVAIGVTALASCRRIPEPANSADGDVAAIKQMLTDWYAAYSTTDEARYREFMLAEYTLLENRTIMSIEDDLKAMRTHPPGYKRKDRFDSGRFGCTAISHMRPTLSSPRLSMTRRFSSGSGWRAL